MNIYTTHLLLQKWLMESVFAIAVSVYVALCFLYLIYVGAHINIC